MIEPLLSDDALLADIAGADRDRGRLHLWWLGQSGFLVQCQGRFLLLDPYLSESLTKKYAGTDKPHVRVTRRAVDPARLGCVELLTSSHQHTDHLDGETIGPILRANPKVAILVPTAICDFAAQRIGVSPERLHSIDAGQTERIAGVTIAAVPASHETVERDALGRCRFLGYVVTVGPWRIYHSGDTVLYDGMEERMRPFAPHLALLPINGRDPRRGVAGNLDGPEAARLAHAIGARVVVPCHFEMFEFNTASPAPFVAECERLAQPYRVMRCGERMTLG